MSDTLRLRAVSSVVLLPVAALTATLGIAAGLAGGAVGRAWLAWAVLQLLVVLLGLAAAAVIGSRRLTLADGVLRFSSLTRRLRWPVGEITAVTYEGHPSQGWHAHLTLYHTDGGRLRLNVYLWHQSELAALLQVLRARNAALRLSPAALGYLAVVR